MHLTVTEAACVLCVMCLEMCLEGKARGKVVELQCKPCECLHAPDWLSFTGEPSGGHRNMNQEVDHAMPHISQVGRGFLKALLSSCPANRPTAAEAASDKYLTRLCRAHQGAFPSDVYSKLTEVSSLHSVFSARHMSRTPCCTSICSAYRTAP